MVSRCHERQRPNAAHAAGHVIGSAMRTTRPAGVPRAPLHRRPSELRATGDRYDHRPVQPRVVMPRTGPGRGNVESRPRSERLTRTLRTAERVSRAGTQDITRWHRSPRGGAYRLHRARGRTISVGRPGKGGRTKPPPVSGLPARAHVNTTRCPPSPAACRRAWRRGGTASREQRG